MLHQLTIHAGQVLTYEQSNSHLWGNNFESYESNAIPVSVRRPREKLKEYYWND